jgi:hypothetical protein
MRLRRGFRYDHQDKMTPGAKLKVRPDEASSPRWTTLKGLSVRLRPPQASA